jgi:hypothetical protein
VIMKDKNNSWTAANQASGVDASCYTGQIYDFMNSRLNRNSYNALVHLWNVAWSIRRSIIMPALWEVIC